MTHPATPKRTRAASGPSFVNVDVEVRSREDLAALAAALDSKALILYVGKTGRKFLASFEAKWSKSLTSPERTIRALLKLVDSLPPNAARIWKRADSRIFNVGFDGGDHVTLLYEGPVGSGRWRPRGSGHAQPCETSLSPELLRAVADVGGSIVTTVYPARREVPSRRPKGQ